MLQDKSPTLDILGTLACNAESEFGGEVLDGELSQRGPGLAEDWLSGIRTVSR